MLYNEGVSIQSLHPDQPNMDVVNSSYNVTDDGPTDSIDLQYWQNIVIAIIAGLISITGLIGNSAVILAVAFCRKLQTAPNAFVTSLAVADLTYCFFVIWWVLWWLVGTQIPGFAWLCAITSFMLYWCQGVTLFTLTAIAVNRLVYITKNDLYKKIFTSWKLCIMVATPWILSFGATLTVHLINLDDLDLEFYQNQKACTDIDTLENPDKVFLLLFLAGFIIPSLTIFICYIKIYIYVRNHFRGQKQNISLPTRANAATVESPDPPATPLSSDQKKRDRSLQQQMEITKNLFIVASVFFIAYVPYFIHIFLVSQHLNVLNDFSAYLVNVWVTANSAINFFIYTWKHPDFKIVLRHMMRCSCAEIPGPSRLLRYILSKMN